MKLALVGLLLFMAVGVWPDSVPLPQPALIRKCRRPSMLEGQHCLAAFRRYRWDDVQRKCVEFLYGGCRGTDNLFDTKEKCQEVCGLMTRVPPCMPPRPGASAAPAGCVITKRMKLENGCFENLVNCSNKQSDGACPPLLHHQQLPPDCKYIRITGVDGCSRSVIDCSAGPARNSTRSQAQSAEF